MSTASSPCVRICQVDHLTGLCVGCGRTLEEIATWSRIDETTRREIMAGLPQRLEIAWRGRKARGRSARR
jgi:predicted Fe-S protein YdhL (DUF1289 family)